MAVEHEIPVLTEALQRSSSKQSTANSEKLQADICALSLTFTEARLRKACKQAEREIVKQVMNELRAELPSIVRAAIERNTKT